MVPVSSKTVTLQKAHRILDSLKQMKNTISATNHGRLRQVVSVNTAESYSKFIKGLNASKAETAEFLQKEQDVVIAIGNVKRAIFKANVASGVSDLIEDISVAQQILSLKKKMSDAAEAGHPIPEEFTEEFYAKRVQIEMDSRNYNMNFQVQLIKSGDLESEIKALTRKINDLTDQKTELNAKHKVDIEIPDSLLDDLML